MEILKQLMIWINEKNSDGKRKLGLSKKIWPIMSMNFRSNLRDFFLVKDTSGGCKKKTRKIEKFSNIKLKNKIEMQFHIIAYNESLIKSKLPCIYLF